MMQIVPAVLEGHLLRMELLDYRHLDGLRKIAVNPLIWEYMPRKVLTEADFDSYIAWLGIQVERKSLAFYTLILKSTGSPIGCTGLMHYDEENRKVEIGGTWLAPSSWKSGAHAESKYLLLNLCFSENELARVEFHTRESNLRSQKALEKIGAKREGLARWDRIQADHSFRNSLVYSIIRPEWPSAKLKMKSILKHRDH